MRIEMNFGAVKSPPPANAVPTTRFRMVILGDFTARANRGELVVGDDLAKRKPVRVDVDNLDDILGRWNPSVQLPLGKDEGALTVAVSNMDDFHPDQLFTNLELFTELSGLRRRLKNTATFAAAAKEVQAWSGVEDEEAFTPAPKRARGAAMPIGRMSDFAQLVGRPAATSDVEAEISSLIKRIVGPHVLPAKSPQQDKLIAAVDSALSDAMRSVLHHPDFQALESLWRSVDLLVRRVETSNNLQIVLLDITAEEIAADLSQAASIEESGLYKLLVEQPAADAQQGPYALMLGAYTFDQIPPHVELLGRIAKLSVLAGAPFLAATSNDCLKKLKPEEVNPLVKEAWDALRGLPESAMLGLTVPRFMLRWPYGKKTEPITPFAFEEFTQSSGVRGMLWGNGAFLVGLLLAETFNQQGMKSMKLGAIASVDDIPYYYYTDADGDQIALPCTDRLLTEALCQHASSQGLMPVVSFKGRNDVRIASFQSLAGKPLLGPWSTEKVKLGGGPAPAAATAAPAKSDPAAEKPAEKPAAASGGDDDLDALLASLGGDSSQPAEKSADKPAGGGDDDLDALLASLGGDSDKPADKPASGGDDDLDALLASLGGDDSSGGGKKDEAKADDGMDPDLAALLADL
ncbi:MAG TPA: type VI secretion system contractile sheath large subunit [Pirellulaceae bacterium]|nr:type VI secretion system contractile sheath large subunit [Pirellulaceae bacterium]